MISRDQIGILLLEEDSQQFVELARRADELQIGSAWTIEYYNRNSLVRLALMASCTSQIRVGTAVTAAFARAPLMIATAIADIASLAPGRTILGLGSSTARMNADWYGVEMEHPAPRLEELITLLRLLWAHESGPFDFSGRFYNLKFAHLDKAATAKVDIYSAGVNERMVRVAGRGADGFVGHPIATCDYLNQIATPAINLGLSESDRPPGSVRIATQVITAVHPDRAEARRRAALQVAFYSTVKTYEVIFALHGYGDERQAIRTAFIAGDTEGMLQNTSDRMLQEMAVFGTAEEVMDQLQRYDSVADEIMLYPPHYGLNSEESLSTQVEILDMLAKYPS